MTELVSGILIEVDPDFPTAYANDGAEDIREAFNNIYNTEVGKALVDRAIHNNGGELKISVTPDPGKISSFSPGWTTLSSHGTVVISLGQMENTAFRDDDGGFTQFTVERVLIHELFHAVDKGSLLTTSFFDPDTENKATDFANMFMKAYYDEIGRRDYYDAIATGFVGPTIGFPVKGPVTEIPTESEIAEMLQDIPVPRPIIDVPDPLIPILDLFFDAEKYVSPLVLDLDGDGVELTSLDDAAAFFDMDADGFAERTGWVTSDDGLLALDRNSNGIIDDINELFGNATLNGFAELSELDSNQDGVIDSNDAQFSNFLVWKDEDQNAFSSTNELRSLDEMGISEISLTTQELDNSFEGNLISDLGTFKWDGGAVGQIVDAWFSVDETNSFYRGGFDLVDNALLLPGLRGYGTVKHLPIAISQDQVLLDQVSAFADLQAGTATDYRGAIEDILFRWTGVEGVASESRGWRMDGQQLAFIEAIVGENFLQRGVSADPGNQASQVLGQIYHDLFDWFAARLLIQGPFSEVFGSIDFSLQEDAFSGSFDAPTIIAAMETNLPTDTNLLGVYWDAMVLTLDEVADAFGVQQSTYDTTLSTAISNSGATFTLADLRSGEVAFPDTSTTLTGGAGTDTYTVNLGDGEVVIDDNDPGQTGTDVLAFGTGISQSDLLFSRTGTNLDDLQVRIAGTGDVVTISQQFADADHGIEEIHFDDGTVMTEAAIKTLLLTGTDFADDIAGFSTADTLQGGEGNDYLEGRGGADTYIFNSGDGVDEINDTGPDPEIDILKLGPGILPGDVTLSRSDFEEYDMLIEIGLGGDRILVDDQFGAGGLGIEEIHFDNATVWDEAFFRSTLTASTSGDDVIDGFIVNDSLTGGLGDDTINGIAGNDTLEGEGGDDYLVGGVGTDTYVFEAGDGTDVIYDAGAQGDGDDVLDLGAGILPAGVTVSRGSLGIYDAVLDFGANGQITLDEQFAGPTFGVERIEFDNGTVWTWDDVKNTVLTNESTANADLINGFHSADSITGAAGDDTLLGGGGNDTLTGGTGNDSIEGAAGDDTYHFAVGDGADVINEQDGAGTDKIVFGAGIATTDLTVSHSATDVDDLVIDIGVGGDQIVIEEALRSDKSAIESFEFNGGTTWTWADLRAELFADQSTSGDDEIRGSYAADTIAGGAGNDSIYGNDGNDDLTGGTGNDSLFGSDGDDTYHFALGDGADVINESNRGGADKIVFGAGIATTDLSLSYGSTDTNDVVIDIGVGGDQIVIDDALRGDGYLIESFEFNGGPTWTWDDLRAELFAQQATSGADTIYGSTGADTITGAGGNDTLHGGVGNDDLTGGTGADSLQGGDGDDTYHFAVGDGADVIDEANRGGVDKIVFGAGITTNDITLSYGSPETNDLVIDIGVGGDQIVINDALRSNGYVIESIEFDGGPTWTWDDVRAELYAQQSTSGADTIYGSTNDDTINGAAGNDTLHGGHGNDDLTGGIGADSLQGGDGDDTYHFAVGDGADVINEDNRGGTDKIVFGAGIATTDLTLSYGSPDTNDVVIDIGVGGDQIVLDNALSANGNVIESFEFDGGTVWSWDDFRAELFLQNSSGNADTLYGSVSGDTIAGAAGNDSIFGGDGADDLTGGTGADSLEGGDGDDTYRFASGDGADVINENNRGGDDKIVFGAGITTNDLSISSGSSDVTDVVIDIGVGGDQIVINDALRSGNYVIETYEFDGGTVWTWDDILAQLFNQSATLGDDLVVGTTQADVLFAGPGNDTISASDGDDILYGETGDDVLKGWDGNDTYNFRVGDGSDLIDEANRGGTDKLVFGAGISTTDLSLSYSEFDANDLVIDIGTNGDRIEINQALSSSGYVIESFEFADGTVWTWSDLLAELFAQQSTFGNDTVRGSYQADTLSGSLGEDKLYGNLGTDDLTGGAGDDFLQGGDGNDTFNFAVGDGSDLIDEANRGGTDKIVFGAGIATTDLALSYSNADTNDLVIDIGTNGDRIEINQALSSSGYAIESFEFDGGTTWTWSDFLTELFADQSTTGDDVIRGSYQADTLSGGQGNDQLYGNDGADDLTGGAGDDYLQGGDGNDTFNFAVGDGSDLINEANRGGTDKIVFGAGIATTDLALSYSSADPSDLVIDIGTNGDRIEINQALPSSGYVIESFEFDGGTTWTWSDFLAELFADQSTTGDDVIHGSYQADTISGGQGDDELRGNAGNDDLTGGTGDDYIVGWEGNDTYHFAVGDGSDVINEVNGWGTDKLVFGPGIATTDLFLTYDIRDSADLVIDIGTNGDRIIIEQMLTSTGYRIETFEFDGGTVWDWTDIQNELSGLASVNSGSVLNGTASAETLTGGTADDQLYGLGGNDTLQGGAGDDYLAGGANDDVYEFNVGDGSDIIQEAWTGGGSTDKIVFGAGIATTDLTLSYGTGDTDDLVIDIGTNGDRILLEEALTNSDFRIEEFEFNGGTTWTWADMMDELFTQLSTSGADNVIGTNTADSISGGAGDDSLNGGLGYDTLNGGAGDDYLVGGSHNDVYEFNVGDGSDIINESWGGGTDKIVFGAGIATTDLTLSLRTSDANDLVIDIGTNGDRIIIEETMVNWDHVIESFEFNGGTTWTWADMLEELFSQLETSGEDSIIGSMGSETITGGAGDDHLNGAQGHDTLRGGAGDDYLEGGNHNDVYEFNVGDGSDIVNENGGGGTDKIVFGAGIATTDLTLSLRTADSDDLVIDIGTNGDRIVIEEGMTNGDYRIESFEFDGGTTWTWNDMVAELFAQQSTTAGDSILGSSTADSISGGMGDDSLDGGAGYDTLHGGEGDDYLFGGAHNDVYQFNIGDGSDTINETGSGGTDKIVFGPGIVTTDLTISYGTTDADDLIINIGTNGDRIVIEEAVTNGDYRIESFEFDGGPTWSWATLLANIPTATSGDDSLTGTSSGDTLRGLAGNDTLSGAAGDDYLVGGTGADSLDGGADTDTASYLESTAGVTVDLSLGTGTGGDAEGDSLANIENLEGSEVADALTGESGVNLLSGRGGDDTLVGGAGADTLDGGIGLDQASYGGSSAAVTIDLSAGTGVGGDAQGDVLTGIENVEGSTHDDSLTGDANDNVLIGAAGADTLDGGDGLDTAGYAQSSAGVTVDLSAGTGTGGDAQGDALSNIENVVGSGHNDVLTGDTNANTLKGSGGDDQLTGGAGADTLDGGLGADTASYSSSASHVDVDLSIGTGSAGDADGDVLSNIENLEGSAYDDALTGDDNANDLDGAAGDDVLAGGAGADSLDGGAGSDRATYALSALAVAVNLTTGTGTGGDADGDTLTNIEDLEGSAFDDTLVGDSAANNLIGGVGDDHLTGAGGADTLDGSVGIDTASYLQSSAAVTVNLSTGVGTGGDAQGDSYLAIENAEGSAHADTLTGHAGRNVLTGAGGADTMDGGLGIDMASYLASLSAVTVDLSAGTGSGGDAQGDSLSNIEDIEGSALGDTLTGSSVANALFGKAGGDTLSGLAGNDRLDGGTGADSLAGGLGSDTFIFKPGYGADVVSDFDLTSGTGDVADITDTSIDDLTSLLAAATQQGADTVIDFGSGDTLTLSGVDKTSLQSEHFVFG